MCRGREDDEGTTDPGLAHPGLALGPALVAALARGDWEGVASRLHPDLHLRVLTPGKLDEANGADSVERAIDIFKRLLDVDRLRLVEVLSCDVRPRSDDSLYKVSYSFRVDGPGTSTDWVLDQEAYYDVKDDLIIWMVILSSSAHPSPNAIRRLIRDHRGDTPAR